MISNKKQTQKRLNFQFMMNLTLKILVIDWSHISHLLLSWFCTCSCWNLSTTPYSKFSYYTCLFWKKKKSDLIRCSVKYYGYICIWKKTHHDCFDFKHCMDVFVNILTFLSSIDNLVHLKRFCKSHFMVRWCLLKNSKGYFFDKN